MSLSPLQSRLLGRLTFPPRSPHWLGKPLPEEWACAWPFWSNLLVPWPSDSTPPWGPYLPRSSARPYHGDGTNCTARSPLQPPMLASTSLLLPLRTTTAAACGGVVGRLLVLLVLSPSPDHCRTTLAAPSPSPDFCRPPPCTYAWAFLLPCFPQRCSNAFHPPMSSSSFDFLSALSMEDLSYPVKDALLAPLSSTDNVQSDYSPPSPPPTSSSSYA